MDLVSSPSSALKITCPVEAFMNGGNYPTTMSINNTEIHLIWVEVATYLEQTDVMNFMSTSRVMRSVFNSMKMTCNPFSYGLS